MKFKNYFLLSLFIILILCSCSHKGSGEGVEIGKVRSKTIDGIPNIYNPNEPLKGEVTLALEKIFEIDSLAIDINSKQPPSISEFIHQGDRIYFFDAVQFKIYIFDGAGKLLQQIPIKGQGPGEIDRVTQNILEPLQDDVWLPSINKVIKLNKDCKYVDEFKFKKQYRDFSVIDDNCFIGRYFLINSHETNETKRRTLVCTMFNREEKQLTNYLDGQGIGGILVNGQAPNGQPYRVFFVLPLIAQDILYGIDREHQMIYLCKNMDYIIYLKDFKGKMIRVIHKEYKNKELGEEDRKEIIGQLLSGQPPEIKKMLAANLPKNFCAVINLQPLPRGYLAVYPITSSQLDVIDIFDPEGRYIYRVKYPGGIPFPPLRFYRGGILAVVQTSEERDIYREYRIKNLPEIFGNTNQ